MQNQNNTIKSVKFTYNGDIRRFTLTPEVDTLEKMLVVIRELVHLDESPMVVKYLDDESEWITMDRDIEFETALSLDGNVLRLDIADEVNDAEEVPVKCERRCGRGRRGRGMRGHGHGPHHPGHFGQGPHPGHDGEVNWRDHSGRHGRGGCRGGRGRRGHGHFGHGHGPHHPGHLGHGPHPGHFGHGPHPGHFGHGPFEGKPDWEEPVQDENVPEGDMGTDTEGHPWGHGPHPGHGHHFGHGLHHFGHGDMDGTESDENTPQHWRKGGKGKGKKCGKGGKGKGRRGKGWKHNRFDSDSESSSVDPSLSAKELREMIQKLVQSKPVSVEALQQSNQNLREKKEKIKAARQNPEITREEIDTLRSELVELKKSKFLARHSLFSTKKQICKLRKALREMKKDNSENTSEIDE